jgi:hypothetical protein
MLDFSLYPLYDTKLNISLLFFIKVSFSFFVFLFFPFAKKYDFLGTLIGITWQIISKSRNIRITTHSKLHFIHINYQYGANEKLHFFSNFPNYFFFFFSEKLFLLEIALYLHNSFNFMHISGLIPHYYPSNAYYTV